MTWDPRWHNFLPGTSPLVLSFYRGGSQRGSQPGCKMSLLKSTQYESNIVSHKLNAAAVLTDVPLTASTYGARQWVSVKPSIRKLQPKLPFFFHPGTPDLRKRYPWGKVTDFWEWFHRLGSLCPRANAGAPSLLVSCMRRVRTCQHLYNRKVIQVKKKSFV